MKMDNGWRVPAAMLVVQAIAAGLQLLSWIILTEGTFAFALLAYRQILAALTLLPFALYWERDGLKKLSFSAFFWIFMVALTGITMAMGFFYYGLKNTSATYATNFLNLIPVTTFALSTIFRVEKLRMHTRAGKFKITGAALCLVGTLVTVFYKGTSMPLSLSLSRRHHLRDIRTSDGSNMHWDRGTIFLVASSWLYGLWFVLLVKLIEVFPYRYLSTMLTCLTASAQTAILGLCIDHHPKHWRLGWNLQLLTIAYSGILGTAAVFCMLSWAVSQKGPTYPSIFSPLSLILVAILEALLFGQEIPLGRVIGMAVVIVGLYAFLWGKQQDSKPTQKPDLEMEELKPSTAVAPKPSPASR